MKMCKLDMPTIYKLIKHPEHAMHVHIFSGSEFAQYTIPSEQSPTLGLSYYKSNRVRLQIGG